MRIAMLSLCLVCFLATGQAVEFHESGKGHFIQQWLLLAPLENPAAETDAQRVRRAHAHDYLDGEAAAQPRVGDQEGQMKWRTYTHKKENADLMEDVGPIEQVTAYFYTNIHSTYADSVYLSLGSDDTVKAWLNGQLVHSHIDRRSTVLDHQLIPVQLQAGQNTLLIKVVNNRLGWGLACRILTQSAFQTFMQDAYTNAGLIYDAVFAGTALPRVRLDAPLWMSTAFGPQARVEVDFYDADYNRVTRAEKVGRYGAIVKIIPPNDDGQIGVRKRFITFYKGEQWIGRRQLGGLNWEEFPYTLPAAYGIPQVTKPAAQAALATFTKTSFFNRWQDEEMAILLAGLYEMHHEKTTSTLDIRERDAQWWRGLRKQLGMLAYQCRVQLPTNYQEEAHKPFPLLLFLHGSGGRRTTDVKSAHTFIPDALERHAKEFGFILAAPLCYPNSSWSVESLALLLDELAQKYRVDKQRVYLSGLSMGGGGSWLLAGAESQRFAALAPICGWVRDVSQADKIARIPCWIHHGAIDRAVTLDNSQRMLEAIRAHGSQAVLTVFPQTNHENAWLKAYRNKNLFKWMAANALGKPVWPSPQYTQASQE